MGVVKVADHFCFVAEVVELRHNSDVEAFKTEKIIETLHSSNSGDQLPDCLKK